MVRKITVIAMIITYLFGCGIPPLMNIWNVNKMIFGIPAFFMGLWIIAGLLVIENIFLFLYERNDQDIN